MKRAVAFHALLLASTLAALSAHADEPPPPTSPPAPIIVVLSAADDRFGLRLQAELVALGFDAVLAPPDTASATGPASVGSVEQVARSRRAIAAIRAVSSEHGVEVWIADRVTGKTVVRDVTSPSDASDRDAALALAAVDLLRASLLEVALPKAPLGDVPAPPELSQRLSLPAPGSLEPRSPPTLRVSLAPGVLWSPGGMGPAGSLDVGLAWIPTAHVGAAAFVSLPLSRPSVSGRGGAADLSVLLGGVGMRFVLTPPESRWSPSADAGVMVTSMESRGAASPGYLAKQVSATLAAPYLRAGLALAVTPMLRVRADVLFGFVVPGVSVQLAKREVAAFGLPILLSTLGADFGWF